MYSDVASCSRFVLDTAYTFFRQPGDLSRHESDNTAPVEASQSRTELVYSGESAVV